jgi:hypothetical protein
MLRQYPDSYERVRHSEPKKIFGDIFQISPKQDILFDEIYYYAGTAVFCREKLIVAVLITYNTALLSINGSSLSLSQSIDHILFLLGNKGLSVFKENGNTLYLHDSGTALFDDKSDGVIDMAGVFLPYK